VVVGGVVTGGVVTGGAVTGGVPPPEPEPLPPFVVPPPVVPVGVDGAEELEPDVIIVEWRNVAIDVGAEDFFVVGADDGAFKW